MSFLYAVLGGIAIVLIPYSCLRALSAPDVEQQPRWILIGYGAVGVLAFLASVVLILVGGFLAGLAAAALACVGLWKGRKLRARRKGESRVDYVVEGSLLEDAMTPRVYAELSELAEKSGAKKRDSVPPA